MTIFAINAMIVEAGRLSGIGHYTVQLAQWFARINDEQEGGDRLIVFCRPSATHHFANIKGVEIRAVPMKDGRVARVLNEQLRLPAMLRQNKVDAVLNPAFTGPVRGASTIVTTVHDAYFLVIPDLLPRAQQLFLRTLVPFCCRRSTRVVTTATATMRDLEQYYPELVGKISVVPMANRLAAPTSLPAGEIEKAGADTFFVLFVAAVTGNKNPDPLVAAVRELRQHYPDLTLVHVGKDPEGILARAIDRHDARNWVTCRSGISDEELAVLYRRCLCVVIPSMYEGFGLPVLEAQASGAPVVSSNRGALPEVGGDGALYFDPTNVGEIRTAINQLIEQPEAREALRRTGFRNQQRFTWEKTARKMLDILRTGSTPFSN